MTEAELHGWLTWAMFGAAAVTFLLLLGVTAPYGRHVRAGWGPHIPYRWAWVVMESPAVLVMGAVYLAGPHRANLAPLALLTLWQLHYVYRAFVYPLRARAGRPWPLAVVALGFLFQVGNAYLNARWLSAFGEYPATWLTDGRFFLGAGLFAGGWALNLWSDARLRSLRAPGTTGYSIPRGGAFELVSCPNYLGEILEWCGWALATASGAGLAFAVYTLANLGPRALAHHRWYRREFPDYPPRRRALLPYIL